MREKPDLDWLMKCRQCKHYYQVQADADEVRCRLKHCRFEQAKKGINKGGLRHADDLVRDCQVVQSRGEQTEKVTNGDMIMALFPNIELEVIEDIINVYSLCEHSVTFDTEWWEKPYRTGEEK